MQKEPEVSHRFLDEAGDTTFYGKGKIPIIGCPGVSACFIIGMAKFKEELQPLRLHIKEMQKEIETDPYFKDVSSVQKKIKNGGFFFHATDDVPEIRAIFFKYIKTLNFSLEAVVGRKIIGIFQNKHNNRENEFYADMLSHLLKNKFQSGGKLVLNIAERSSSTSINNLNFALEKAKKRYLNNNPDKELKTNVFFDVQTQTNEPLLNVADYVCWTIQRVFEKGETRYYNYLEEKISLIIDLYDQEKYLRNGNYYSHRNKLTDKNKISPS